MLRVIFMRKNFETIIKKLPESISRAILFLPENILENICEIRLRADNPVMLTMPRESLYLCRFQGVSKVYSKDAIVLSQEDIKLTLLNLCNHSVYAHQNEIKEGFLSLGYGFRAGLGGRYYGGEISDIYSVNIRVARAVDGCAEKLSLYLESGLLIAGRPGSGKTTVLRDAAKILSKKKKRVCVIDTRQEISPGFNLGEFCDVVIHSDRNKGIEIALRTLSPEVMIFDEIATLSELKSVNEMLNAGVSVITSAHVSSTYELRERPVTARLVNSGAISHIALLGNFPGDDIKILSRKEVFS